MASQRASQFNVGFGDIHKFKDFVLKWVATRIMIKFPVFEAHIRGSNIGQSV